MEEEERGTLERKSSTWRFESKTCGIIYEQSFLNIQLKENVMNVGVFYVFNFSWINELKK